MNIYYCNFRKRVYNEIKNAIEKEHKTMKTTNDYRAMFENDRDTARETVKAWRNAVKTLEDIHRKDVANDATPEHTVDEFVKAVGFETARFIIATLINGCAWDGRISNTSKAWAESVEDAFDEEGSREARIFTDIHRAHLDQIAHAMAKFVPEIPEETVLWHHTSDLAHKLKAIAHGEMLKCEDCGEMFEGWVEDVHTCPCCGYESDVDFGQVQMYEFFDNALDIEYRADSRKRYKSVAVLVTCGGPAIWIDTGSGTVDGYWGTDKAHSVIDAEAVEQIDNWFDECYSC